LLYLTCISVIQPGTSWQHCSG